MTIQFQVPPALETRLLAEAAARGEDVETVVVSTLTEKFGTESHVGVDRPRFSVQEFERALFQLEFDGTGLPSDFSRADIYGDHD
jgi:hypothetical protein